MESVLFIFKKLTVSWRNNYFGFYFHNNPMYLFASIGYLKIWWEK